MGEWVIPYLEPGTWPVLAGSSKLESGTKPIPIEIAGYGPIQFNSERFLVLLHTPTIYKARLEIVSSFDDECI